MPSLQSARPSSAVRDIDRLGGLMIERWQMFIAGHWEDAADGGALDVTCPSDGIVFGSIPRGRSDDVSRAVEAARNAFVQGSWSGLSAVDRGRILIRFGALILQHQDELADLEAKDVGKTQAVARADIAALARYCEFYGGAVDKLMGDTIPTVKGYTAMTVYEPHGVVGAIIPWNYPAQMFGRVATPALAMGNSLVVKPAEDACLSVLRLAELSVQAGIPPGVVNVVTGLGPEAGAALAAHEGVDFITFTGSPESGTAVQKLAADHHIGVTLELGGKSPQIVFADADLDTAEPVIINAIIANSGQTCVAGSRLLVEESILPAVMGRIAARFRAMIAGPHTGKYSLGPLISAKQLGRVSEMIREARQANIPVIAEGQIAQAAPRGGFYVAPIVFGPVPRESALARQEVFGPVLVVIPFANEEDAIRLADDTAYGLAAGIWTRDGSRAMRVARRIRTGQAFINGYGAGGGVEFPFGGVKHSGHGREKGVQALTEFSALKTIIINYE
jgi:aldehyde dehydrogenase (NAD+)